MVLVLFILGLIPLTARSDTTLCDLLDLDSCSGVTKQMRRSSSGSLPSSASAANLNPANVSFDRGFGIEAIYQPGNQVNFNVATGSGKLGGALISQSLENSFFGNRVVELNDVILERHEDKKQFKSKKLSLALGGKLIRKKNVTLDAGLMFKRHSEIKDINLGIGFSGRVGPIHIGASVYKDDLFLDLVDHVDPVSGADYSIAYGEDTYTEKFTVVTSSAGTKIKNLALDAGLIRTRYEFTDEASVINLYSASFIFQKYLVNFAIRNEITGSYKVIDGELVDQPSQNEIFYGVQYSLGRHAIVGLNYNYYLLKEISFTGIVYF